jgi:hypothetical protein
LSFGFVLFLLMAERTSRGGARYNNTTGRNRPMAGAALAGFPALLAIFVCVLPLFLGFVLPGVLLLKMAFAEGDAQFGERFLVLARNSFVLAGVTAVIALLIAVLVRDPARIVTQEKGSLLDLLRMRALWPLFAMMALCYAPIAAVRGLWVGPYYAEVFGATADEIGQVTLWMGLAMVLGSFAYGPLERVFGTRKGLIMVGNVLVLLALIGLWGMPLAGGWVTLGLFVLFGLAGTSFPMVIAHGRAFLPAHLTGRGVTLLNLFGIGAVGVAQFITGRLSASVATMRLWKNVPGASRFIRSSSGWL